MEYVNFGTAGVKVSRIALGLGLRGQGNEAEAERLINHAIDRGINLIDCANVYGTMDDRKNRGLSEQILGNVLKDRRHEVVITSKVASPWGDGPNDKGASRFHVMREVENSLKRLQTDHIDVYLVHSFDETTPLDETVRALDDLVRSGKVLYVGCCNFDAWQVCHGLWVADRLNAAPFICVQNKYSLLNRGPETGLFGAVREFGLGLMAYSPLGVGLLSGAYRPSEPAPQGSLWATRRKEAYPALMEGQVGRVVTTVLNVAEKVGKSPAQVAMAWVLAQREVTVAVSGSDRIEHLEDVVGAVGWKLEDDLLAELDQVSENLTVEIDA
jgi:aryl-alcohol dehydrogenase-like predicted oxidoreductase